VLEAIIAGAVVLLIIVGFWWTRGAGGVPGGIDDPAREELRRYNELGDRVPAPSEAARHREDEVE
jgi:hypothetical protein